MDVKGLLNVFVANGALTYLNLPTKEMNAKSTLNSGNPLAIYRGLSAPPGPKPRKSLEKVSRGQRVWKKSRKSLCGTFSRLFPGSRDFFQTFSRLFRGAPGPEAPGDFFQTFSGFRARRARVTPVNGQRVPKLN